MEAVEEFYVERRVVDDQFRAADVLDNANSAVVDLGAKSIRQ